MQMTTRRRYWNALLVICCFVSVANARVETVRFQSKLINTTLPYNVAGLSMGGYGAIKFGLKSPSTFVFAASMSGAFSAPRLADKEIPDSWRPSLKNFGDSGSQTRTANDLFEILQKLTPARVASLPYFYFDCGTEDSQLIFPSNRELAALMFDKKIPHEFRELPGDHSWSYWDQQVRLVLQIAAAKMRLLRTKRASRA